MIRNDVPLGVSFILLSSMAGQKVQQAADLGSFVLPLARPPLLQNRRQQHGLQSAIRAVLFAKLTTGSHTHRKTISA